MRYLSFIIIIWWSIWAIITKSNAKPSDDLLFWLLATVSIVFSIIALIEFARDLKAFAPLKHKKKKFMQVKMEFIDSELSESTVYYSNERAFELKEAFDEILNTIDK